MPVHCSLEDLGCSQEENCLTAGGFSSVMTRLVMAIGVYFATATKRADDETFAVQVYHKVGDQRIFKFVKSRHQ